MHKGPKEEVKSSPSQSSWQDIGKSIITGGVAGAVEVGVDHPLWRLKTRYQDDSIPKNQKLTFDPRILYRGWIPNMLSMVPITAVQVGTAEALKSWFSNDGTPLSKIKAIAYNATGGAFSAIMSSPTELVMAQQTSDRGFIATFKHIYQTQGIKGLTKGMFGTSVRDAKFTVGYGFAGPYLKERFAEIMSEGQASVAGGATAGVGVAALSQPWDSLKTAQQTGSNLSCWELAKQKLKQEGIAGLYKGSFWRMSRVASATMLMSETADRVSAYLKPKS